MKRLVRLLSFTSMLVAVGGCTSVSDQVRAIDETPDCCASFREISFIPLPAGKRHEFTIPKSSKPFTFRSTKSHFAAFSLPEGSSRKIEIRSKVVGFSNVTRDTFCPSTVFLDKAFIPVNWYDVPSEWSPAGWTKTGYFIGTITAPENARYLVVYTEKAKNGSTVKMSTPRNKIPYLTPDRGSIVSTLPCAPTGDLSAEILS
jgi:hypothetical protein